MNLLLWFLLIFITILFLLFLFIYLYIMDEPSIRVFMRTIRRDIKAVIVYCRLYIFIQYCHFRNLTVVDFFHENVKKHPNRVCLIFEDEEWTYRKVNQLSNKIAHFFLERGFQKGDEVALLMENCPDYACIWLGLAKIGVVTALINTKQKTESLAHSMNSISMKGLIFSQTFAETIENALPYIQNADIADFYCYYRQSEKKSSLPFAFKYLNIQLQDVPTYPPSPRTFKTNFKDKMMYIYTSGTSGLPKAAVITHRRFLNCGRAIYCLISSVQPCTFYNTLPMYHIAGGVFYLSVVLIFEAKMVIKKKFSASNFWKDIVKHKVSICVYISEICRYILNQPETSEDCGHQLQILLGSGLKSHVWKELQERFAIKNIFEVYGSTEGNIVLANHFGKVGAAGIISRIFYKLQGVYLIKVHPETGEILRDENGLCIRCKPGEPGELVGKVSNNHILKRFDGYLNTTETNKKIIRDCFAKGNTAFASGDVFVMDEDGYVYFKDRFGDTFRWKGENVSTTEVENIMSKLLNFSSCMVYGVEIPDNDGRAGMAAVQIQDPRTFNFEKFYSDIADRLPVYAVPLFLRISNAIEETGTYKLKKANFQDQGYNPENVSDPLYVLDMKQKTYVPLSSEMYNKIMKGMIKF